jgi:hypothetical protein
VELVDATIGLQIFVGALEPTDEQLTLVDVLRDGSQNILDVVLMLKDIVGEVEIIGCG